MKTYELAGRKWKVVRGTQEQLEKICDRDMKDESGWCDVKTATLYVVEEGDESYVDVTMWHEFVHSLFYSMGWHGDKEHDEVLVDALAHLLHQFERTRR